MQRIGIAGGIGSGKTAATDRLSQLGWPIVDADLAARVVTEPDRPAWLALRDAFGASLLREDRSLDRGRLAEVVFHDASALKRLNHITHDAIKLEMLRQLSCVDAPVAFVALPLFRTEHRVVFDLDEVWSVQVRPETALTRLVSHREFSDADARARLDQQMSNEERGSIVDRVIWNEGSLEELYVQLDDLLRERA